MRRKCKKREQRASCCDVSIIRIICSFSVGTANLSNKIITRGFYIEYRLSLVFARSDPTEALPHITSLKQWAKIKSTKLDMAARLCHYFLVRDDLPLPTFADGDIIFPDIPPAPTAKATSADCKIVVFTEFPSMLTLFTEVSTISCSLTVTSCSKPLGFRSVRRQGTGRKRVDELRQTRRDHQEVSRKLKPSRLGLVFCGHHGNQPFFLSGRYFSCMSSLYPSSVY